MCNTYSMCRAGLICWKPPQHCLHNLWPKTGDLRPEVLNKVKQDYTKLSHPTGGFFKSGPGGPLPCIQMSISVNVYIFYK